MLMLPPSKCVHKIKYSGLTIASIVVHYYCTCVDFAAIIAQQCNSVAIAKAPHVLIRYSQRDY